jgi:hypothetical protein
MDNIAIRDDVEGAFDLYFADGGRNGRPNCVAAAS